MVLIYPPPPTRNITPKLAVLESGRAIKRIFAPTSYGSTATGFRYYGPLHRFDHQKDGKPTVAPDRGIIYAGFSLSCCLIEVFGDDGVIDIKQQKIAKITLTQSLKLLDLRGTSAWDAGSVVAMTTDGRRRLTQAWSRYFYEHPELYGQIDGLIFNNAHNGEEALALYERAATQMASAQTVVQALDAPALRNKLFVVANRLNLLVEIN
ncbi:MAG: RES family NAD+ phosphorylase [Woeseiaceae bacterium]|nr:RES family NAD+ phosphorylase [Woeseiaceae bacterium]